MAMNDRKLMEVPMNNENYVDVEKIRTLKARYCRLLDTKQWAQWRDVFTDEFTGTFELPPHPASIFASANELVETNRSILENAETVHQIFAPEITVHGDDRADGLWQQFDFVRTPGLAFKGYGHYKEKYQKCADGQWRIDSIHLTRLTVEILDAG